MKHTLFLFLFGLVSCVHKDTSLPETTTMKLMRMSHESQKSVAYPTSPSLDTIQAAKRIVFVSGTNAEASAKLWSSVKSVSPDLIVIVGSSIKHVQKEREDENLFANLDQINEYSELRYRTPFLSVWSNLDRADKSLAKNKYVKYWNYIPRVQPENFKGLEHSIMLGNADNRLQLILLDNFYYSEQPKFSPTKNSLIKDWTDGEHILGKAQWNWLKSELKKDAKYRIIVSPLQIGINKGSYQRWGLFPQERQRFFDLIRSLGVKNLIVVSDGIDYGAISKVDLMNFPALYDISVGSNQTSDKSHVDTRHIVQGPFDIANFGLVDFDANTITLKSVGEDEKILGKVTIKR